MQKPSSKNSHRWVLCSPSGLCCRTHVLAFAHTKLLCVGSQFCELERQRQYGKYVTCVAPDETFASQGCLKTRGDPSKFSSYCCLKHILHIGQYDTVNLGTRKQTPVARFFSLLNLQQWAQFPAQKESTKTFVEQTLGLELQNAGGHQNFTILFFFRAVLDPFFLLLDLFYHPLLSLSLSGLCDSISKVSNLPPLCHLCLLTLRFFCFYLVPLEL